MSHTSQKRNARIKAACAAFLKREVYTSWHIHVAGAHKTWIIGIPNAVFFSWEGSVLKTHLPNKTNMHLWNRIAFELKLPLKIIKVYEWGDIKIRTPWGTRRVNYSSTVADLLDPNYGQL